MTPADLSFRIALLVMCAFSLFAAVSLVWMFLRARFPLLGLPSPKPPKGKAGQGNPPAQVPIAKPVVESPKPPEQVRMVGDSVAVGENTRNRIILRKG